MDTLETSRAIVRARVSALRAALHKHHLAAWVLPSSDPHISEYLPGRWQGREWLTGFTGSVGTAIVTEDFAGLWVDGRYWVQAEAQLAGTGITMMKTPGANSQAHLDWLAGHLAPGSRVGVDASVLALSGARALKDSLSAKGIELETGLDLLDEIWPDRPTLPVDAIYDQEGSYAPMARTEKLALLRAEMKAQHADYHFISTLDDIAWTFNLRGADVGFNPVFVAHALIGANDVSLFVAEGKISAPLAAQLKADGVTLKPYDSARNALASLGKVTLLVDPRRITLGFREAIGSEVTVIESINPGTLAKSQKSAGEAAHVRRAMEEDGAALAEFFSWLEPALGNETITELTIDEKITAARARRKGFVCQSFSTIAGFNANGAMPHYRATPESHSVIEGDGLLLIDSGGQYQFGTTDITRVVPVGNVSVEQKRDFTIVLKGMIALSVARFPRGTRSPMLDALARAPIWAHGLDYGHGTGHGVGYFLNVHEGPQSISPYAAVEPQTAMEPGMITSNEPGLYRPGKWGIRIENLVLNVPYQTTEFGEFLAFETLTLCPIDTRCIDPSLLREDELEWLNDYHSTVRTRLFPHVTGAAADWLIKRTEPFSR